ncbi:Crp/Fnr family transcriptional regulator [Winogradskyella endarachnes]|uniref:Cyclic nucleotide-binding domain-containing protein n=1 Tax=Winogradskyella endarachnes TaxID=2681965 RepID=A0A6L6U677_9FLAO|nr:Crp/Fnr family transcriptional regulator [Winogradskyella endarachnes]MUU77711.1 cyclic nucleotide-binding domain-containing protein [Winogradskyella endarachnes]
MSSDSSIIKEIFKGIDFSPSEIELINSVFHKKDVEKGTILINYGEIVNHQYFISNGCLRSYYIDRLGKEHTIQFGIKDWWISDFTSFFSNEKAILTIEAIQNSTVYVISKADKEKLYNSIPKIDKFFRIKLEKSFAAFQKRILANLALPAKERYLYFIESYPSIEKNIKNYHIASYLGITTESLSRIRKELSN